MSKFASSVVSFVLSIGLAAPFGRVLLAERPNEAPKAHTHLTHVTSRRNTQRLPEHGTLSDRHALAKCARLCKITDHSRLGGLAIAAGQFEPEDKITNVVHQLLGERGADKPFNLQDGLLSVGLTSLDMTNLVLSIEGEFSIRIPDRLITPANFRSVATIGRLLRDLMTASVESGSRPFESPTDRADAAPAGS